MRLKGTPSFLVHEERTHLFKPRPELPRDLQVDFREAEQRAALKPTHNICCVVAVRFHFMPAWHVFCYCRQAQRVGILGPDFLADLMSTLMTADLGHTRLVVPRGHQAGYPDHCSLQHGVRGFARAFTGWLAA